MFLKNIHECVYIYIYTINIHSIHIMQTKMSILDAINHHNESFESTNMDMLSIYTHILFIFLSIIVAICSDVC